jgi:hypothetical protein
MKLSVKETAKRNTLRKSGMSFPLDWKAWDMTMRLSGCGLRRWPAILASISGFIKMSQSCQEGRSRS